MKYIPNAKGGHIAKPGVEPEVYAKEMTKDQWKKYEEAAAAYDKAEDIHKKAEIAKDLAFATLGKYQHITGQIGKQGSLFKQQIPIGVLGEVNVELGNLKLANKFTDMVNMIPYGKDYYDVNYNAGQGVDDFVKFKFRDIVNNKYIIFRAILSGISDSITPEWNGTRYIGRPDQVYVYTGTDREVGFTFEIYPKTKQEFPVLMEKLNYLIGLCYPTFTKGNRMVAPFINLTIGDMFVGTPGFLDSLSVDVDDNSPWELDEGLQFPHHITCNCSFTYIGKYLPSTLGKHYELQWLEDKGWTTKDENRFMGTFQLEGDGKIQDTHVPHRTGLNSGGEMDKLMNPEKPNVQ